MTDDRQAVITLAENLVKAMQSVSASTPSKAQAATGGVTPSTIQASKIIGLPAAFSSIMSGIESAAADGDAVAQQTLVAIQNIANGNFETITADTAMISRLYATFGKFIHLVAEDAEIGELDVETLRAEMGIIGLLSLGTADIKTAQIEHLSSENAFLRVGIGDKIYIDDLAVNDANIVSLAAGTILVNDSEGNLVELYVDAETGDVTTRQVSFDGSDIIETNSLNGNRIVQNSITTAQLNASEIFAREATVMDLIADNIEATRLFASQGFIPQLETTIISSSAIGQGLDLSNNTTITMLQDSISLLASNASRTFIQEHEPFPVHTGDTWFDPTTENHYVSTGIIIPVMTFGHDSDGNLCNVHTDDYQFSINSNGELMVLVVNEEAERIIIENDIDFSIVDDYIHTDKFWKKIENVAFSNLKISVDGIVSEVYDSTTGESRIEQNANKISLTTSGLEAVTNGTTPVPHVKTSSIEINQDNIEVKSTGNVDIKANNFSISFNTNGTQTNKSRVDISNNIGIKVSDQFGGYFQATYNKIGLYDYAGNPKLYMNSSGNAVFSGRLEAAEGTFNGELSANTIKGGTLTLGGTNNGSITVNNASGVNIGSWNSNGITIKQGSITGGTIIGASLTLGGANNTNGSLKVKNSSNKDVVVLDNSGIKILKDGTAQFYVDGTGNATFKGNIDGATGSFDGYVRADKVQSGTMVADRISGGVLKLGGSKTDGRIEMYDSADNSIGSWNKTNGLTVYKGNINGANLVLGGSNNASGTLTVNNSSGSPVVTLNGNGITVKKGDIRGSTLTLGGSNNASGTLTVNNSSGSPVVTLNSNGITVKNGDGNKTQLYIDATTGNATFSGELNAAKGTFDGTLSANSIVGGTLTLGGSTGGKIYIKNSDGENQLYIGSSGNLVFKGRMDAECIYSGYIDAKRIAANSIEVGKLTGTIENKNSGWGLDFDEGTFTIGDISANNIKSGTLTLGGTNNTNGTLKVKNANGTDIITLNNQGIDVQAGTISGITISGTTISGSDISGGSISIGTAPGTGKAVFSVSDEGEVYISSGSIKIGDLVIGSDGKLSGYNCDFDGNIHTHVNLLDDEQSYLDIEGGRRISGGTIKNKTITEYGEIWIDTGTSPRGPLISSRNYGKNGAIWLRTQALYVGSSEKYNKGYTGKFTYVTHIDMRSDGTISHLYTSTIEFINGVIVTSNPYVDPKEEDD